MSVQVPNWIMTDNPAIYFEDTEVGRLKKQIWDMSEDEMDAQLAEFGIPSPSELGKPGCYIQTTPRSKLVENRRKNDVCIIPVGCTENHGMHANSGLDSFMVTQFCEGIRRYTEKRGAPVTLAHNPLSYGGHPFHHAGMPGTIVMPQTIVKEILVHVMLGLWNDGFRKIIIVNNHGQLWQLETAIHEFMFRYQLPGIYQVVDWHRAVREFFYPRAKEDSLDGPFIHADEAETSVAQLLFPDMVDMSACEEAWGESFLPGGHFDISVDTFHRPHRWSEGEGHVGIELASTPEGVIGNPRIATATKAKRPILGIMKYLVLCIDQILEAYPPGKVPPVEKITLRTAEEMEPYLKEPLSPGWKSVYGIPKVGLESP